MYKTFAYSTLMLVFPSIVIAGNSFAVYSPTFKSVQLPQLDLISEVEPGKNILETAYRADIPAIRLSEDIVHAGAKHGTTYSLTIPAGQLELYAYDSDGKYYASNQELKIHWKGFLGGAYPVTAGIYVPNDKDQTTKVFYGAYRATPTANESHPGIDLKFEITESYSSKGFKRELVYQGAMKSVVSILYREFINDLARPAFSQDLKYDLADGDVIAYKGARFQIIKAGNLGITYKVIKPLE